MFSLKSLVRHGALVGVFGAAACATDGSIDWRGGEHRDLSWRTFSPMNTGPGNEHGFAPTVTIGTTIYVVAGGVCSGPKATVVASRVSRNGQQARTVGALPFASAAGGAVVLDGKIHYMGGCSASTTAHPEMNVFDFISNQWVPRASMSTGRYGFATAVLDGKIYVAGGGTIVDGTYLDLPGNFEVYDPATDEWTTLPRLPTERLYAAGAAADGKFFVIGGQSSDASVFHDAVEVYDPRTGLWSTGPSLPSARTGGAAVLDGRIVVVAGRSSTGATTHVDLYDPYLDEWTPGPDAPVARWFVSPGVVGSKLYTPGGVLESGSFAQSVEGLVPIDISTSASQPGGWNENGSGGPGGPGGPQNNDSGNCSIRSASSGRSRSGSAILVIAAFALVWRRRSNTLSA